MTETDYQAACAAIRAYTPTVEEAAARLEAGLRGALPTVEEAATALRTVMEAFFASPESTELRAALERQQENPGRSREDIAAIRREFLALGEYRD